MDKKLEWKRLFIYLGLTFGLTWAYFFLFILTGYHSYDVENRLTQMVGLGMLFPFIGNILTRWITKEGFALTGKDSLMLGIDLRNKKWIFYLLAIISPFVVIEIRNLLSIIAFPACLDFNYNEQLEIPKLATFLYPLGTMANAMIVSFAALGEEGGWRGYMMPKLINLLGYKKAILVGGVIWGLWHAPLTCIGHNFGKDYPGFPYLGILIMCVLCTMMGVVLAYVTEKTHSIWPATFMHAVNNAGPSILIFYMNSEIYEEHFSNNLLIWGAMLIPQTILAIVIFILACKEEKKKKNNE